MVVRAQRNLLSNPPVSADTKGGGANMNEKSQPTARQILYAQALQIAIQLSGGTTGLSPVVPNIAVVQNTLERHRALALCVFEYLAGQ
jgi:hypothetical protein